MTEIHYNTVYIVLVFRVLVNVVKYINVSLHGSGFILTTTVFGFNKRQYVPFLHILVPEVTLCLHILVPVVVVF